MSPARSRKPANRAQKRAASPKPPSARARFAGMSAERARLVRSVARERDVRMAEYRRRLKARAMRATGRMLCVLAEGDSWFDYPVGRSVVAQLEDIAGVPIANMAHHGDEVRQMLALAQRREITERLREAVRDGLPFDALLFSGGGNDIVGDELCIWLNDYTQGMRPDQAIDLPRFDAVLAIIEAGYRDLIGIRDRESPGTTVFLHGYDFAVPTGEGVCFVGPWLKPSLDFRGVPPVMQWDVVRAILERFERRLTALAGAMPDVVLVPTQGTLQPTDRWWANEIHPTDKGFEAIARKFHAALRQRFPRLPYA